MNSTLANGAQPFHGDSLAGSLRHRAMASPWVGCQEPGTCERHTKVPAFSLANNCCPKPASACLQAPGSCPYQPHHIGLPEAGSNWLPGLLGTCLHTGCSRRPLISSHGPPPASCWATRRHEATGPVRPACSPPPLELTAIGTHSLYLQTGKQALVAHRLPMSDKCCHGLEEHVLTGRRKPEHSGRLCPLPCPASKSAEGQAVAVRPNGHGFDA
jgi:hypothetical protein